MLNLPVWSMKCSGDAGHCLRNRLFLASAYMRSDCWHKARQDFGMGFIPFTWCLP